MDNLPFFFLPSGFAARASAIRLCVISDLPHTLCTGLKLPEVISEVMCIAQVIVTLVSNCKSKVGENENLGSHAAATITKEAITVLENIQYIMWGIAMQKKKLKLNVEVLSRPSFILFVSMLNVTSSSLPANSITLFSGGTLLFLNVRKIIGPYFTRKGKKCSNS